MKKILSILTIIALFLLTTGISFAKTEINVPDTIRIKLSDGKIIEIDLDEYLYGIVSSEMGTGYTTNGKFKSVGIEALKAQAIASRSYAVYSINHSKYDGYDVTSTTSDQVYKAGEVKDIVKQAVDSTTGQVMTYDGKIISAYFFSTSGGHTESSENVWYSALPYARGVEDPYEPYIDGKSEWEVRIPADEYGEIEIIERSDNDRVTKLRIGDSIYEKTDIRAKLGVSFVKSTWFDLEYDEEADEYVFKGKGYGHGVGMSQYGAMGMAEAGFNYQEILKWYYTDVEILPERVDYIIIDDEDEGLKHDEDNLEEKLVQDENNDVEIKEDDDAIKKSDKDYSNSKPETVTKEIGNELKEVVKKEEGPMLKRLMNLIKSWR